MTRTRTRLEAAWATKSERPLAIGTYSVSMLAKMSAGAIARRIISQEPSDFPAYLGWSGNKIGDALMDEAGIPKAAREFNLHLNVPPVALSGHPDALEVPDLAQFEREVKTESFTVRAVGKKPKEAKA